MFVLANIASILLSGGLSAALAGVAKILFAGFLVLFVIASIFSVQGCRPSV